MKNNLQNKINSIQNDITNEWKNMYHNASLLHIYFTEYVDTQFQSEIADEFISNQATILCMDLKEECKEKFNIETVFEQVGRGGATICPQEFMTIKNYGEFCSGRLKEESDFDTAKDYYIYLQNVLAMFLYINNRVHNVCNNLPQAWKEYIESNPDILQAMKENKNKHFCPTCRHLLDN